MLYIFGISIIVFVVGILLSIHQNWDWLEIFTSIAGVVAILMLFTTIPCLCCYLSRIDVDKKINLYIEENEKISSTIEVMVENYKEYEKDFYYEFKPENPEELIALYPEIASNSLVQEQIATYTQNQRKICELKEEQIDMERYKKILLVY